MALNASLTTAPHGSLRFDALTKTKTIDTIVSSLSAEGVSEYISVVIRVFLLSCHAPQRIAEDGVPATDGHCDWALDQFLFLVRNARLPRNEEWFDRIVSMLMVFSFFKVGSATTPTGWYSVLIPSYVLRAYPILCAHPTLGDTPCSPDARYSVLAPS